jgi:diguanylate cyclase (GGDEF)-like protein
MIPLIEHILSISARRDRTEVSEALLDGLEEMALPYLRSLEIYRVFAGVNKTTVFACSGIGADGRHVRNAYLPEAEFCFNIQEMPLLRRAQERGTIVAENTADGGNRIVLPIAPSGPVLYLIDLCIANNMPPQARTVLMALVEFCSNHIALLDYGETDNLTGLPNRKTFDKHLFEIMGPSASDEPLQTEAQRRRRRGAPGGQHWFAVCDIDHFKLVNDTHGHLIGDEVLVMFARLMRDGFRFQDQLFRFGGEEFVIVLQPTSPDAVQKVFNRFRTSVQEHPFSRVGQITVSIGYSQLLPNDTPADVVDRADEALYWVKRHGRNGAACYEDLVSEGKLVPKSSMTGEVELF